MDRGKKSIAIVGGGIGGLTAAYYLYPHHKIRLFEKSNRLGGNAYTYVTQDGQYLDIAVAAFGKAGYHHFYGLLNDLGIETRLCANSYMSLHNMDSKEGLYLTPTLRGAVAQGRDLVNFANFKSVAGLFVGLQWAFRQLDAGKLHYRTMEECLQMIPAFKGDARRLLVSALCLLSSMSAPEIMASPAEFFLLKLKRHNDVISPRATYSVRCVEGGTQSYVNALADRFREHITFSSEISRIVRNESSVQVVMSSGQTETFDAIILALNADQALALLDHPTKEEKRLLGAWKYKEGRVVVHRDYSAFPPRDLMQAYTFLYTDREGKFETSVNGALWHEPNVPNDSEYICTQHPNFAINPHLIEFETTLRTPIFDFKSFPVVPEMPSLNGTLNTFYCGSHFGFGLHDDAVRSAMEVAQCLGATVKVNLEPKALSAIKALIG
ncbi:MAG: FAD-dependent oxidoreductase [Bdellovibrionaceae bacterium]|nr:FAD-dependent oxidoreductase [Bdellovibrionales bacterium]MCB9082851.1 FAD-dependent oxidoreductase [Pseudobdellovibrionaceae bacterium]